MLVVVFAVAAFGSVDFGLAVDVLGTKFVVLAELGSFAITYFCDSFVA